MTVVCYIGGRDNFLPSPVVVGPTPPSLSVEGSNIRLYAHRPIVSPMYPASMPDGPPPFNQQISHLYESRPQISDLVLCVYVGGIEQLCCRV